MDAVVVDAGSKLLKAGFAAPDQDPALVIPTKMERVVEDGDMVNSAMFEEVKVDPVVRGFIREWDAMEDLLHHVVYSQLAWEVGNEGNILFTEPLSTPKHIASKRFEIAGIDLTELLFRELQKSNPLVKIDISTVERLKEQYSCCADDQFAYEHMRKSAPEKHVLPDGQVITIEKERYIVGEALFQPSILGLEEYGVVEQLVRCISSVSSENHRQLLENTVLCGGTSSMTGFEERFQKESNLCSSSVRPTLVKPPEYMPENLSKNSAWMGGAILAKVVFPQNQHITKGEYNETGPAIVHRKCF
ncbi:Actin related protein [Zostera marina]|uniref:Actin related protein n=1 Tax=Zostera marina TaxID=29655 RepID=A0A0K9PJ18_ZOSMR|nr:Actin related protein [Zostera marina]